MTGPQAKYFANMEAGYVYPLFKTHKYKPDQLNQLKVQDIQIRLVQSAGNTFLSKITAFLEHILKPISQCYCTTTVDEYCKDSAHYLDNLMKWKYDNINNEENQNLEYRITAVDVKGLYPNIPINLVEVAIEDAMIKCSTFSDNGKTIIKNLVIFCLKNTFIQFKNKFYKQAKGIVTGENNSVSIANIALHYIIAQLPEISYKTEIFKRFIDDVIYITVDKSENDIKQKLLQKFANYGLDLTFRDMDTTNENGQVEFLDVLHCCDSKAPRKFIVTDFVKQTAINTNFLNGNSFHPPHIFKGTIVGEGKRLRRLNETDERYQESIQRLKLKCYRSRFKPYIIEETFQIIEQYNNIWTGNSNKCDNKAELNNDETTKRATKITWPTGFKSIFKFNTKEKTLASDIRMSYCKPPALSTILINYKKLSKSIEVVTDGNGSRKCGKCGVCGNHGKLENMVLETEIIHTKHKHSFKISQSINCKNFGIYAAQCKLCQDLYVGQTSTSFSDRWSGHRYNWNTLLNKNNLSTEHNETKDDQALFNHYNKKHQNSIKNKKLKIWNAFHIIYLEKPPKHRLDIAENFWIDKLKATINIQKTFLPSYK